MTHSPRPILDDLRRMAPVWGIVFLTASGTLFALRTQGARFLERGLYESKDTCVVAGVRARAGERLLARLAEVAAKDPKAAATAPEATTLREHFATAAALCPEYTYLHRDLAMLAAWGGDTAESHYQLGLYHRSQREPEAAKAEFALAAQAAPNRADAQFALAQLLAGDGATEEPLAILAKFPELATRPDGQFVLAQIRLSEGRPKDSVEPIRKALAGMPSNYTVFELFRRIHDLAGEQLSGAEFLAELARKPNSLGLPMHHLAAIYFDSKGDPQRAEAEYREAVRLASNNVNILVPFAGILHRNGRFDEARDIYNRAIEVDVEAATMQRQQLGFDPRVRPAGQ